MGVTLLDSGWWALAAALAMAGLAGVGLSTHSRMRVLRRALDALAAAEQPPVARLPGVWGDLQSAIERAIYGGREQISLARVERDRLAAVLEGMAEGVLVLDGRGEVLLTNPRAGQLLDFPAGAEEVGRPLIELTRQPDLLALVRLVEEEPELDQPLVQEIQLDRALETSLQVTATSMSGPGKGERAYILVLHDISAFRRLERMRRDFVANVSHELRTPLAAIGGYTEILMTGAMDDPDKAQRFLGIIERHTKRLERLVDDLLSLSDLELGRTELRRVPVRVDAVTEATFEILRGKAASGGVALENAVSVDTPTIEADPDRLEQALLNLVENAIKYTPDGGRVTVSATTAPAPEAAIGAEPPLFVEIAVSDTGVGVPSEDLPRLAERFYRVDKARSRELGGTGLGLAIVKHVVQAHGGQMAIESELDRGTTVRLILPATAEAGDDTT